MKKVCTICKREDPEVLFTWNAPYCDECHDLPGVARYGRPVQDLSANVGEEIDLSESN